MLSRLRGRSDRSIDLGLLLLRVGFGLMFAFAHGLSKVTNLGETMLVAAFHVHAADPFQRKELALVYAVAFGVLLLTGAGRYSVDAYWLGRRR